MTEKVYRTVIQVADNYPLVPNSDNMFHDVVASELPEYCWTTIEATYPRSNKLDKYVRHSYRTGHFIDVRI
jgi:hypothetical protein